MKNLKNIFIILIICSFCLISCNKNTQINEQIPNNENQNAYEENINTEQKNSKEKIAFNSDKTSAKFEYSNEFKFSNIEEVKEQLSQNNIQITDEMLKEILKSSKNEVILVFEDENINQLTLEQLKEQYNQLSKYDEFQINIEKSEIVKVNNQDILCIIMEVQENKMQIVTAISNEKTVTIEYISNVDNFDNENAQIILDSISI